MDDDPINVRVYCKVFSKYSDFNVKHTEDVEEILRIAQAGEADLVLMGICSRSVYEGKEVDALDITKMLKAHPQTTHIPVIVIVANSYPGELRLLEESGVDSYIRKPIVDHQKLVDHIRMFLLYKFLI